MLPTLFVSHGSPDMCLQKNEVSDFLRSLTSQIQSIRKPKNIIVISAHWVTRESEVLARDNPELIYDFYGFPQELYRQQYQASNNAKLIDELTRALEERNIKLKHNLLREGYDHGVWTILSMMYPQADSPVVQLSLPSSFGVDALLEFGKGLQRFREDSLIVVSGNLTHNLRDVNWRDRDSKISVKEYAKVFRDWVVEKLEQGDVESLKDLSSIPYLKENHPTLEHFMPLYIALGSSKDFKGESLLENYMFGNLAMDTIIFKN